MSLKGLLNSSLLIKGSSVLDGSSQRDFIYIFQCVAHGDAFRNDAHLPLEILQLPVDVKVGGVPLDGCRESENDLVDVFCLRSLHQFLDSQVVGGDAFDGADDAAKDVIETVVGSGVLDGEHITHVGHHAKGVLVASGVGADAAYLGVGDVVAAFAKHDVVFHLEQGVSQLLRLQGILVEQVQRQTQRRLFAHSGQFRECFNGIFQQYA